MTQFSPFRNRKFDVGKIGCLLYLYCHSVYEMTAYHWMKEWRSLVAQVTSDIPAHASLKGQDACGGGRTFDDGCRGVGGTPGNPTTSVGAAHMRCTGAELSIRLGATSPFGPAPSPPDPRNALDSSFLGAKDWRSTSNVLEAFMMHTATAHCGVFPFVLRCGEGV